MQPKASVAANTGQGSTWSGARTRCRNCSRPKCIDDERRRRLPRQEVRRLDRCGRKTCKQGNDWLGIPVATIGGYLNYRKSATRKAGFKEFPKDFPGFLEMCKALKKNNTPAGFALGHATGDANGWLHWVALGLMAASVDKDNKVVINSPETVEALEYVKALYDTFIPGVASWNDCPTTRRSWPANST